MGSAERMDIALDIAESQLAEAPLMVCSAMGGITDKIIETYTLAENGDTEGSTAVFERIKDTHYTCARSFLNGDLLNETVEKMDAMFAQFASLIKGITLLKDCSPRSKDALLSFGERLSTLLIYSRAVERGFNTELADSRELIRTDSNFTSAKVDSETTENLISEKLFPEKNKLIIAQGFIASNSEGVTTTLGRGGSDYSASIFGAALNASEIQIWTDVTGIMTSDPRIIPEAATIPEISYEEAGELAFFGAKVVHPATIQPAVGKNIPVYVKNTSAPEKKGTRISSDNIKPGIKAISAKKGITVVNVTSSRMLEAYGFLKRIFNIFDEEETPVDLVTTSEVSVSVTIENTSRLNSITEKLQELGSVNTEKNRSIVSLVGSGLWKDPQFPAKVFEALETIPVKMISLGASEVNLSIVVPQEHTEDALKNLHNKFFSRKDA